MEPPASLSLCCLHCQPAFACTDKVGPLAFTNAQESELAFARPKSPRQRARV